LELVREQVVLGRRDGTRITCSGPMLLVDAKEAVYLALVLHELATNARKYGALSVPTGQLSISWSLRQTPGRQLQLTWLESGVPKVSASQKRGFGTTLIERLLASSGGETDLRYGADGLGCEIRLPLSDSDQLHRSIFAAGATPQHEPSSAQKGSPPDLNGKRILLVEDEPLVAMDIEAQLMAAGIEVLGPVGTIEKALQLIAMTSPDAALVDANLGGHQVDELAAALIRKGIPFAFATGYGEEALPQAFRGAPVLTKPFSPSDLLAVVQDLINPQSGTSRVVPIRPKRT
jgi:CheY-like chemotaxis protein